MLLAGIVNLIVLTLLLVTAIKYLPLIVTVTDYVRLSFPGTGLAGRVLTDVFDSRWAQEASEFVSGLWTNYTT